jgi:hypothetical protein
MPMQVDLVILTFDAELLWGDRVLLHSMTLLNASHVDASVCDVDAYVMSDITERLTC